MAPFQASVASLLLLLLLASAEETRRDGLPRHAPSASSGTPTAVEGGLIVVVVAQLVLGTPTALITVESGRGRLRQLEVVPAGVATAPSTSLGTPTTVEGGLIVVVVAQLVLGTPAALGTPTALIAVERSRGWPRQLEVVVPAEVATASSASSRTPTAFIATQFIRQLKRADELPAPFASSETPTAFIAVVRLDLGDEMLRFLLAPHSFSPSAATTASQLTVASSCRLTGQSAVNVRRRGLLFDSDPAAVPAVPHLEFAGQVDDDRANLGDLGEAGPASRHDLPNKK
jgi:hypothetical protein